MGSSNREGNWFSKDDTSSCGRKGVVIIASQSTANRTKAMEDRFRLKRYKTIPVKKAIQNIVNGIMISLPKEYIIKQNGNNKIRVPGNFRMNSVG